MEEAYHLGGRITFFLPERAPLTAGDRGRASYIIWLFWEKRRQNPAFFRLIMKRKKPQDPEIGPLYYLHSSLLKSRRVRIPAYFIDIGRTSQGFSGCHR